MKLNMKIFKGGKAIYWIVGGVFLFVIFYMIASKGSSGASSGVTVTSTGPSDAAIAASTQLAMANLSAGAAIQQTQNNNAAQVAIATLAAQTQSNETQAAADVAKYTANLDANTQMQYLNVQKDIAHTNAEYSYDTAVVAKDTALGLQSLTNDALAKQLDANRAMFADQMQTARLATLVSGVNMLWEQDRDNALAIIATGQNHGSITYNDQGVPFTYSS